MAMKLKNSKVEENYLKTFEKENSGYLKGREISLKPSFSPATTDARKQYNGFKMLREKNHQLRNSVSFFKMK